LCDLVFSPEFHRRFSGDSASPLRHTTSDHRNPSGQHCDSASKDCDPSGHDRDSASRDCDSSGLDRDSASGYSDSANRARGELH
jgi:hypothetical protein